MGEGFVAVERSQTRLVFVRQHTSDAWLQGVRLRLGAAGKDAQRTAVGGQLFDVKQAEAMCFHELHGREQREIGKVLVIDGVEFIVLHESQQVRELKRQHAFWLEKDLQ